MLLQAIRWDNNEVLCFDAEGDKIPELSGRYEFVRERVLRRASVRTLFTRAAWSRHVMPRHVTREEW